VVNLRTILDQVIQGGVDGVLLSPGQAVRLAPQFQGRDGPALIVRADWMNMPRLGTSNVANAVPQRLLVHQKVINATQALELGATAITIYLFLGYNDSIEAAGIDICARFAAECRQVGLPCIMEPLAYGGQVTGTNIVEILTLGARICVELGADALKIPYTGDVNSFRRLVEIADVPVLVLGGARSEIERDALELFSEGLEAGGSGCLMGRNVTKSPNPGRLIEQLCGIAHNGLSVDRALRTDEWDFIRLKSLPAKCTGCDLCVTACVAIHNTGSYGTHLARLSITPVSKSGGHKVMFCTLCRKCLDVCPTDALCWHPQTGAVELLFDNCTACGDCVDVCPTGVIFHNASGIHTSSGEYLDWYPIICDLCAGEPECARVCPTGAIFIAERVEMI
jgi:class I fructose-bisphosphate aldolase